MMSRVRVRCQSSGRPRAKIDLHVPPSGCVKIVSSQDEDRGCVVRSGAAGVCRRERDSLQRPAPARRPARTRRRHRPPPHRHRRHRDTRQHRQRVRGGRVHRPAEAARTGTRGRPGAACGPPGSPQGPLAPGTDRHRGRQGRTARRHRPQRRQSRIGLSAGCRLSQRRHRPDAAHAGHRRLAAGRPQQSPGERRGRRALPARPAHQVRRRRAPKPWPPTMPVPEPWTSTTACRPIPRRVPTSTASSTTTKSAAAPASSPPFLPINAPVTLLVYNPTSTQ